MVPAGLPFLVCQEGARSRRVHSQTTLRPVLFFASEHPLADFIGNRARREQVERGRLNFVRDPCASEWRIRVTSGGQRYSASRFSWGYSDRPRPDHAPGGPLGCEFESLPRSIPLRFSLVSGGRSSTSPTTSSARAPVESRCVRAATVGHGDVPVHRHRGLDATLGIDAGGHDRGDAGSRHHRLLGDRASRWIRIRHRGRRLLRRVFVRCGRRDGGSRVAAGTRRPTASSRSLSGWGCTRARLSSATITTTAQT